MRGMLEFTWIRPWGTGEVSLGIKNDAIPSHKKVMKSSISKMKTQKAKALEKANKDKEIEAFGASANREESKDGS